MAFSPPAFVDNIGVQHSFPEPPYNGLRRFILTDNDLGVERPPEPRQICVGCRGVNCEASGRGSGGANGHRG